MVMKNLAWHFTGDTLRDGSPVPPVGETLVFKEKIEICQRGYHWSKQPFDALTYSPGVKLHLVSYSGQVQEQTDKGCSSERTIVKSIDATQLLRRFAADQALSVKPLWHIPSVVEKYLVTLDEKLRDAAWAAARDATRAAAWAAARDATRAAAWAAAKDATRAAAWAAARNAAIDATWDYNAARLDFNQRVYKAFGLESICG